MVGQCVFGDPGVNRGKFNIQLGIRIFDLTHTRFGSTDAGPKKLKTVTFIVG